MDIATGGLSYSVGLLGWFRHSLAWYLCLGVGEKEHISLQNCFLVSRFVDLSMVGLSTWGVGGGMYRYLASCSVRHRRRVI